MFLLTHLTDSHSKPWAPVWNQHWACRKWEISTGDRGGREGGDKRKTAERTIDLTFGIQMSTLHVIALLSFPLSPPSLVSLPFCLRLCEHLLAVCVRACSCACVYIERLALWKAPGLLFFPGTVIRWLSQESGQAASYFSRALFLLFHAQRQHDLMWPLPTTHGWNTAKCSRCGRQIVVQPRSAPNTEESVLCPKCFTWKPCDSTREATLRDAVSNVLCRAKGVFWLSTCTHKCAHKCVSVWRSR